MQKASRNSFQHSTAEKHRFILITAPFSRLKTVQMMIIFGNGSTSCHFRTRINGPTPGSVGAPRTRSTTYTYIPKNYPKLIWNQQRSNVLGFGGLVFPLNTGWFSGSAWHKSTASIGHRSLNPSLSPLDKPRVVTFMINTCGGSKEGDQTPTAGYDIILYIW